MKKLNIIILSVVLLSACKKDSDDLSTSLTEQPKVSSTQANENLKSSKVFKANFYTSVDVNPAIPPTPCSGDLPGLANPGYFLHGHATHIGTLTALLSRGQDVSCNLSFATKLLTTNVSGQLAACNGDLIYYTGNDVIDASIYLAGTGTTGTITGTWTITGGTGKFAGASGSFHISGPVNFATGTFSFKALGTINY